MAISLSASKRWLLLSPLYSLYPCGFVSNKNKTHYCSFVGRGGGRSVEETDHMHHSICHLHSQGLSLRISKPAFLSREHISGETRVSHLMIRDPTRTCVSRPRVPVISTSPRQFSAFTCHRIHGYGSPCYSLKLQRDEIRRKSEHPCAKYVSPSGQRLNPEEEPEEVGWEL